MIIVRAIVGLRNLLNHPLQVGIFCLLFSFGSLVLDGTLLRVWGLYRDQERLEKEIENLELQSQKISRQIALASAPAFIERQARDKLDLLGEDDLLFVFPSD
ncbi:MAG: septum formation initiator family protein [Bdellovibrionaceae bacterium]|nr:septum formation initiator family protein [Pseudobdellovibrionaceae bacterium]